MVASTRAPLSIISLFLPTPFFELLYIVRKSFKNIARISTPKHSRNQKHHDFVMHRKFELFDTEKESLAQKRKYGIYIWEMTILRIQTNTKTLSRKHSQSAVIAINS